MAHSSLLGAERARRQAEGRDTDRLGTGDNSDSGSDLMGLAGDDAADPTLPVDVALSDDGPVHPSVDGIRSASGDASGTGERRGAAGDSGREAADIGVDRVFALEDGGLDASDDEDADLAFIDEAVADAELQPVDPDSSDDGLDDDPAGDDADDTPQDGQVGSPRVR